MSKAVRIRDHLYEEIERLAKKERRSLIGQLEILLEQALKIEGRLAERGTRQPPPTARGSAGEEQPDRRSATSDRNPRSASTPKTHPSEPFSLVCPNRENHVPGVYCPECKGDGGKR